MFKRHKNKYSFKAQCKEAMILEETDIYNRDVSGNFGIVYPEIMVHWKKSSQLTQLHQLSI